MDSLRENPREWARQNPELAVVLQHGQALARAEQLVEQGVDPNIAGLGEARQGFNQGLNAVMVGIPQGGGLGNDLLPTESDDLSVTPRNPATRADIMARMEAERFSTGLSLTPRALRAVQRESFRYNERKQFRYRRA